MEIPSSPSLTNKNAKMLREASLLEPTIKNPFIHRIELRRIDKVKIAVNAVLLAPIRLLCMGLLLSISVGLACIITCGYSYEELKAKPLTGWRKYGKYVLRFLGRSIAFCFGFHKIRKNGVRASIEEAPIFVAAPHSSFFDAWVFFVLGLPSSVSRDANAKIPLIGKLVMATQPILVSREDAQNKSKTIDEIKRRAAPDSGWPQTLVFPEGTTTNRTCLITFKPGAFIPGRPIQPVVVRYNNKTDTITWTWQGNNTFKNLFYTLCQFNNYMEVTYLPVYVPNEMEKKDAKLFACNVREKMAEFLGVRTTFHTYEDCRLMLKARELKLPFESGIIEFDRIKTKLNINFDNCQEIIQKFSAYAKRSDGKMSLRDFSRYLDLPPTGAVVEVFNLYDRDKDGYIEFREFLIGLALLSRPVNTEENLELAFNMFDNGKGHITVSDLKSILYSSFMMSPEKSEALFKKIDTKGDGLITYDEFKSYAMEKPEYAQIFLMYQELKILNSNLELERLAAHERGSDNSPTASECGHTNLNFSSSSGEDTSPVLRRVVSTGVGNNNDQSESNQQPEQSTASTSALNSHSTIKIE